MVIIETMKIEGILRYTLQVGEVEAESEQLAGEYIRTFKKLRSGSVFVYERWTSNEFGTATWTLVVGKAIQHNEATKSAGIHPSYMQLCRAVGKRQVEKLRTILTDIGDDLPLVTDRFWLRVHASLPMKKAITYNRRLNADSK